MKIDTNQIEWMLDHATGYQVAKMSGVAQQTISALITGKRKLENLTIITGYKLTEASYLLQDEFLKKNEGLILEAKEDMDIYDGDFEVVAVLMSDGFISKYIYANPPMREDFESDKEFEEILEGHYESLEALKGLDIKKMKLKDLLKKLEEQRNFFKNSN